MATTTKIFLSLILATAGAAYAAPAKPTPAKPSPVKGTNQLAGDVGKMGTTYTLGQGEGAINVTLESAEYRAARVVIEKSLFAPEAGEKLLVLNMQVQNPNKAELPFEAGSLHFTAVDAQDVNHEAEDTLARAGTSNAVSVILKPAQKLAVYAVVRVPAKGPVPKLIIAHNSGGRVVRYDLRGVVKPLPAPIADPADAGGVTARVEVPAQVGVAYPVRQWDVKLVSTTFVPGALGDLEPGDGKRFLLATFEAMNQGAERTEYGPNTFGGRLILANGEKVESAERLLKATQPQDASGELDPGGKVTVRLVFEVDKGEALKTLLLSEHPGSNGRWYAYDVSGIK